METHELLSVSESQPYASTSPHATGAPFNLPKGPSHEVESLSGSVEEKKSSWSSDTFLTQWSRTANTYWLYETFSCTLSISALIGLVILLGHFDGQPRPQWREGISVNTVVSIITAVLKAALMLPITEGISELKWQWFSTTRSLADISDFDSASRGPWGALLFLFHSRPHFLATFGAAITVLAITIDPFSQAVIKYKDCFLPLDNVNASIPRTNNYTAQGMPTWNAMWNTESSMALAIYQGLLTADLNASTLLPSYCPTGNCTFRSDEGASYASLAICQETQDINSTVERIATMTVNGNVVPAVPSSWTLTSGPLVRETEALFLSTTTVGEQPGALYSFEALLKLDFHTPFAVRTSFRPCVKSWSANISNGVLTELQNDVIVSDMDTMMVGDWLGRGKVTDTVLRNGSWHNCSTSLVRDQIHTFAYNSTGNILWYTPDCVWTFAHASMYGISTFLDSRFNNNTVNGSYPHAGLEGDVWMTILFADGHTNLTAINAYMNNLAMAMTANIRTNGNPLPTPFTDYALGTILVDKTCVVVRWQWLILPATMVICSMAFFVSVVSTTSLRSKHVGPNITRSPYKSSPLPLVFATIQPSESVDTTSIRDLSDIQRTAAQLDVKLGREENNSVWNFKLAKSGTTA